MSSNRFLVMVYGRWGSEPYGFYPTLEKAKSKAQTASSLDPANEYAIEDSKDEPGGAAILYKAGKRMGGDRDSRRKKPLKKSRRTSERKELLASLRTSLRKKSIPVLRKTLRETDFPEVRHLVRAELKRRGAKVTLARKASKRRRDVGWWA